MIRKIPVLVALTLFAPGLVASAGEGRSSSSSDRRAKNAPVIRKIDDRMRDFVKANQAAGIVTVVVHRGRLIHSTAVGLADLSGNRPILPDSVFAIASMTKPVTATAVMILRDEGKLDLDDPVSKYVPAFRETRLKGGAKPMREVTLRDCLRHTSGLSGDQRNRGSLAETAEFLARTQLDFEPGSKWQYGPGLSVVGRVVEVVSGMPFDQFLKNRVFGPLEMRETTFKPTSAQLDRLAKVYQPSSDKQNLQPFHHWILDEKNWTSPNPSGGLFSTAADIVRFHQMLLNQMLLLHQMLHH